MKKQLGKEKINNFFKFLKLLFTWLTKAKTVLYHTAGEEMCLVLILPFPLFLGSSALESLSY